MTYKPRICSVWNACKYDFETVTCILLIRHGQKKGNMQHYHTEFNLKYF
jgi:hypothetical protein